LLPTPIDVTQILFQLLALKPVHSIVFIETPGIITNTVEVQRSEMERLIQQRLQEFKGKKTVPPNIA
jgi:L-aminopeptidase/D-esterase-like protein